LKNKFIIIVGNIPHGTTGKTKDRKLRYKENLKCGLYFDFRGTNEGYIFYSWNCT
jgi:hypothetical protein